MKVLYLLHGLIQLTIKIITFLGLKPLILQCLLRTQPILRLLLQQPRQEILTITRQITPFSTYLQDKIHWKTTSSLIIDCIISFSESPVNGGLCKSIIYRTTPDAHKSHKTSYFLHSTSGAI